MSSGYGNVALIRECLLTNNVIIYYIYIQYKTGNAHEYMHAHQHT